MWLKVFLSLCIVNASICNRIIKKADIENLRQKIAKTHEQLELKTISPKATKFIEKLPTSPDVRGVSALEFYACDVCFTSIDELMFIRRVELLNDTNLVDLAVELCTALEIQKERECRGIIELYAPTILYIIDNRQDLSAETVCKFLLNDGDCVNSHDDDILEFTVAIKDYKPCEEVQNEVETPEVLSTNSSSTDDMIIVHLTDIHVDLKYKTGAMAKCKKYACCRDINKNDTTAKSSHLAGYWGDYRSCDTPLNAIEDAFHHIVEQHPKIDAIYFTGDIVDHFLWDTTIDGTKSSLKTVYGLMRNVFKDIPIYPIIGNHEAQNLFAPLHVKVPNLSTEWLYSYIIEIWGDRMSNESIETFKNGGFYSVLIKPGLRVIALNNNPCFIFNFWALYDSEPMYAQFQWLHDILVKAEEMGEKVHILAHIPNGLDEFAEPCSREYQRIIERFKKTIVAQFNGHHEFYGFHLFYEAANVSNPISVAFRGGSLASFSKVNRNYVVYNVSVDTFEVKEDAVWTYNMTEANLGGENLKPRWFKQPTLRESFNLPDLSPETLSKFTMDMMRNSTLFQEYRKLQIKNSDYLLKKGCNDECYKDIICETLTSDNTDDSLCEKLWKKFKN
ncbi:hypothetical protein ACKWTF_010322 [Chironomus riparius]